MGSHASELMDTRRDHILQRYGVAPDARLRSGMDEAGMLITVEQRLAGTPLHQRRR